MRIALPLAAVTATLGLAAGQTATRGLDANSVTDSSFQATADYGPIDRSLGGGVQITASTLPSIQAAGSGANIVGMNVRLDEAFTSTPVDYVANYTVTAAQPRSFFALDFDASATTLYAIEAGTLEIFTVDPATGLETTTGVTATGVPSTNGLTASADGSTWYANTGTELYVGDILTGVFTLVGPMGSAGLMVDISIDSDGNLYGFDIGDDSLYSIDTGTGAATLLGAPVGINANFAQGMDFDWSDNTLYATIYTGGGTGMFTSFDLATGAPNFLNDTFPLNAEMEIAVQVAAPGPGSPIVGINVRGDAVFTSSTDSFVANYNVVGPQAGAFFAIDFDASATTLYAIDFSTLEIFTIDVATGVETSTGVTMTGAPGANGLTSAADGVTWYVCTATDLYVGDIMTGVFTLVGPFGSAGIMVDLSIDSQGNIYGFDLSDDSLYSIDSATGAATLLGAPIGLAANFAQGMDFDWSDDTLYATVYTGGGTGMFTTFDLTTGAPTFLDDTVSLNAEMEMAVQVAAPSVGQSYCEPALNSTGGSAVLCATGSASLAANNLVLTCTNLPANAFAFVLAGTERDFVPMAGMGVGNLCLGGNVGRGVGGQIYDSGVDGSLSAPADWNAIPQAMGTVAGVVGETWNFQVWSRDIVGGAASSNLSNGVSVTIE